MSPLEALVVFLLFALPVWWLLRREAAKLSDPSYLREQGVSSTSSPGSSM